MFLYLYAEIMGRRYKTYRLLLSINTYSINQRVTRELSLMFLVCSELIPAPEEPGADMKERRNYLYLIYFHITIYPAGKLGTDVACTSSTIFLASTILFSLGLIQLTVIVVSCLISCLDLSPNTLLANFDASQRI